MYFVQTIRRAFVQQIEPAEDSLSMENLGTFRGSVRTDLPRAFEAYPFVQPEDSFVDRSVEPSADALSLSILKVKDGKYAGSGVYCHVQSCKRNVQTLLTLNEECFSQTDS